MTRLIFILSLLGSLGLLSVTLVQAHPQDEDIILDIEEGEMRLNAQTLDAEYQAALKRKRLRKLNAMIWYERAGMYVQSGIEHIVPKGLDHILFVLGLYFSSVMLGALIWQVSAFTLAHTLTLGLAATGWITLPASIVEPLIALSIVYVGVENLRAQPPDKWRIGIVFLFGLLHGLGFASVLQEYGLPKAFLIESLVAFNVGVELGQLGVIAAAALLTLWWRKHPKFSTLVKTPVSLLIASAGGFWFVERVL